MALAAKGESRETEAGDADSFLETGQNMRFIGLLAKSTMTISNIKPKAVFLGVLTDIAASTCVGLGLGVLIAIIGIANRNASLAVANHNTASCHLLVLQGDIVIKIVGLIGTTLSTCLGGFVAGRIANPHSTVNALAVGLVSLAIGAALFCFSPGLAPCWKVVVGLALTVPRHCLADIWRHSKRRMV